jgi:hypothetical protein
MLKWKERQRKAEMKKPYKPYNWTLSKLNYLKKANENKIKIKEQADYLDTTPNDIVIKRKELGLKFQRKSVISLIAEHENYLRKANKNNISVKKQANTLNIPLGTLLYLRSELKLKFE